ncbi:hypothetical protein I7I50_08128 [Histoplasma capsulatum G186AR]|uniref:Uncharacterized protein n=1 Tax=Ajellomyces capsulatus TaxID=5037 RepID=A0A8H8CVI6_AJECA|nr:hypothetical protein I7I52_08644 [Histoplasma capsulatum]QSS68650.1 hypothetical protein I7I50_08128 [Histoplasma capsulatum G186AR]
MHFSLHKYTSQQQWAIDVCTTPNDTTMRCAFFALSLSALGREKKWKDGGIKYPVLRSFRLVGEFSGEFSTHRSFACIERGARDGSY